MAAENVGDSFRFESSYHMIAHSSEENGLNCDDGNVAYHKLLKVLIESVAGYALLHNFHVLKCKFLSELLGTRF